MNMLLRCLLPANEGTCNESGEGNGIIETDISSIALNRDELAELHSMFADVLCKQVCVKPNDLLCNDDCDQQILDIQTLECSNVIKSFDIKLQEVMSRLGAQSRTAALWMQYIRHVNIMKKFLAAERLSDWVQHMTR
jgi:hypothetical protein